MDPAYETIALVSVLSTVLRCIGWLAGLGVGIFLIVRKRTLPGILAVAAFILFGLASLLYPLVFNVFYRQISQTVNLQDVNIALTCITGIVDTLAYAALIAAFILMLKPAPPPPDNTFYPG